MEKRRIIDKNHNSGNVLLSDHHLDGNDNIIAIGNNNAEL